MINVNLFINMKKYTMDIHFIGDLVPGLAQFCLIKTQNIQLTHFNVFMSKCLTEVNTSICVKLTYQIQQTTVSK